MILSDFSSCAQSGNSSDPLINRICKVAQASDSEGLVQMKSYLQLFTIQLQERLDYVAKDLTTLYNGVDTSNAAISTIQSTLTTIQSSISSLDVRLTDIETQMTDVTEGKCYRSRTSNTSLNGSVVTFLWDSSVRMNSNYCTYNVPTAEYTIVKAGWYEVSYKVNFNHVSGSNIISYRAWIALNGSTQLDRSRTHGWTNNNTQGELTTLQVSFMQQFAANDTIKVQNDAASGSGSFGQGNANYNLNGTESFFAIQYIDDP
jgi:hypothetical protein